MTISAKKIMERNQKGTSALFETIERLKRDHSLVNDEEKKIVDIVTFCNDPRYLDLPNPKTSNFRLWLSQIVTLKCLYIGSQGNEQLSLTKDEIAWLYDKKQQNVIDWLQKRDSGERKERISELVLVLGRRSSKTMLTSVICAYEVYKLIMVGDGDPYKYYDIPYDKELAVLNVATSKEQAGRLFTDIKARIRNGPFFRGRIAGIGSDKIRIFTDIDLKKKEDPSINIPVEGSVVIVCGHSNPDSLRGLQTICLLFDELAFYDESDKVSGTYFYTTLKASVGDFSKMGAGLTVSISTPGPKTGVFYKLWKESLDGQGKLSFRMPTWDFNPTRNYDTDPELVSARQFDPERFDIEYGVQWPEGGMYGIYFPEQLIQAAIRTDISPETKPDGKSQYFFHIDPALSGNRYVMVAVKKNMYRDVTGERRPRVTLAFTRMFEPDPRTGLDYSRIDAEVLSLCKQFRPIFVTYDQYNSVHSLQMLRKAGYRVLQTAYNRGYKNKIYQNLKDLMSRPERGLYLYDETMLIKELMYLKFRPTARGQSIGSDTKGECPTDDLADCLAGSAFMACGQHRYQLPESSVVNTGRR
jgi:hypothetical protein